jgi:hypothetical protein
MANAEIDVIDVKAFDRKYAPCASSRWLRDSGDSARAVSSALHTVVQRADPHPRRQQ